MSDRIIEFKSLPSLSASFSAVGGKEGEGPLGACFDKVCGNSLLGEKSWEQAESRLQQLAIDGALARAGLLPTDIDCVFGGDLLNQCVATAYAARETSIPFFGLYGACSTAAEGHILAAAAIDGGFARRALTVASSHFCAAEKQFRFPLEYGGLRTPTAQWTATAAGAFVFSEHCAPPYAELALGGRICDMGVKDISNMGAAMAPAAADTLLRFFSASRLAPEDFDAIITGDLGLLGSSLLKKLLAAEGLDLGERHLDCGAMLYRREQNTHSGGSGAGCSAAVMASCFLPKMAAGELSRILFVGTGALMSPLTVKQGESIPAIAHLIAFTAKDRSSEQKKTEGDGL